MASEITQRQRTEADDEQMFEMFLIENGWTSVGYSLTYYPEWLKLMTFPCYERIGGKWTMKPEKRLELDEWLKGCRQRKLDRLAREGVK
jgi:hypothetical protein